MRAKCKPIERIYPVYFQTDFTCGLIIRDMYSQTLYLFNKKYCELKSEYNYIVGIQTANNSGANVLKSKP